MTEGCPPESAGGPHEAGGDTGPRWMAASPGRRKAPGRQNPAYRPPRPPPTPDLRRRGFPGRRSGSEGAQGVSPDSACSAPAPRTSTRYTRSVAISQRHRASGRTGHHAPQPPDQRPPPVSSGNGRAVGVATPGRPGGRPPRPSICTARSSKCESCDPRPSRRTTATASEQGSRRAHGGCDPRPSRRTTATTAITCRRCRTRYVAIPGRPGGRPPRGRPYEDGARGRVAIPGRPGGRPPHPDPRTQAPEHQEVAIPGRPGGRPPPRNTSCAAPGGRTLRSPAVLEDDRHEESSPSRSCTSARCDPRPSWRTTATSPSRASSSPSRCCDPRPSWRTTATGRPECREPWAGGLRSPAVLEDDRHPPLPPCGLHSGTSCDPRPSWRTTATTDLRRLAWDTESCDPRPSWRTTATRPSTGGRTGSCSRCDPRPSWRTTATRQTGPPARPHHRVAIPGRPGGRPPPRAWEASHLLGNAVAIPGRPGGRPPQQQRRRHQHRRWVAIPGRPGGRPPRASRSPIGERSRCCDPRPSWRTTATPWSILSEIALLDVLRSPAVLEDDRHGSARRQRRGGPGCDPRPSWRTTATPDSSRRVSASAGCDPRPSWRTTATQDPGERGPESV